MDVLQAMTITFFLFQKRFYHFLMRGSDDSAFQIHNFNGLNILQHSYVCSNEVSHRYFFLFRNLYDHFHDQCMTNSHIKLFIHIYDLMVDGNDTSKRCPTFYRISLRISRNLEAAIDYILIPIMIRTRPRQILEILYMTYGLKKNKYKIEYAGP